MADEKKPTSTVEKLLREHKQLEKLGAIAKEGEEDYRKALNGVASTENGQIFLRTLIEVGGIFDPIDTSSPHALLKSNERNTYLRLIRPYLNPEMRRIIETP